MRNTHQSDEIDGDDIYLYLLTLSFLVESFNFISCFKRGKSEQGLCRRPVWFGRLVDLLCKFLIANVGFFLKSYLYVLEKFGF